MFQTGNVNERTQATLSLPFLAKSVLDMWNQLFTEENW